MKKYVLILLMFYCYLSALSQGHDSISLPADHLSTVSAKSPNLKIGDKVPDIVLHKILNYHDSSALLSDFFKGKLLIIDFWATWCPPCIASLPILDSIQNQFRDHLNIITVTYEPENKVKHFFKRNPAIASSSLPFIVSDKRLNSYFKHSVVPHEVWIDSLGYVRAITNNYDITRKNIDLILHNGESSLLTKRDSLNFNPSNFSDFKDSDILFRSVLAKFNPSIQGGYSDAKENYTLYKRLFLTNRSIIQLFYFAFCKGQSAMVNPERVIYNTPDSSAYIAPSRDYFSHNSALKHKYSFFDQWFIPWARRNLYSYELITKKYLPDSIFFEYMMQDLNKYFDITGKIEKRPLRCLVIKLTNLKDTSLLKTKGLKPYYFWSGHKRDTLRRIQNVPMSALFKSLNMFRLSEPVIDETNYKGRVDLDLNIGGYSKEIRFDKAQVIRSLSKYGLTVVEENRMINVLVINKRKGG